MTKLPSRENHGPFHPVHPKAEFVVQLGESTMLQMGRLYN